MKFTSNQRLNKYLLKWHELTFQNETMFEHIDKHQKRLDHLENDIIPKLRKYRNSFKSEMIKDPQMRKDFDEYMRDQKDYVVFNNFLMSSENQKDHPHLRENTGNGKVPFITKGYQLLMWELSKKWRVVNLKSRFLGVSYGLYTGFICDMIYDSEFEFLVMSEVEKKVDKTLDWTQSAKGRMKSLIRSSGIFDLKRFYDDKFLTLSPYSTGAGFSGSSTTATATNQARYPKIWVDEAGLIGLMMQLKDQISAACDNYIMTGTLNPGSDMGFRFVLDHSVLVDYRAMWARYKELFKEDLTSKEIIEKVIDEFTKDIPLRSTLKFKLNWKDDPIKSGKSDYYEIACNEVFNDPDAIATQIDADENAPSPDRTLYNATKENIRDDAFFKALDHTGMRWVAGFDPGSIGSTCFVPALLDPEGRLYIFPAVYMEDGTMVSFVQKMAMMAPGMMLYPEESVKAYSRVESGWWTTLQKYSRIMGFKLQISQNRDTDAIGLVSNISLSNECTCPFSGEYIKEVLIHEDNEEVVMNYIAGMKYTKDKMQKKWSHAAEALMAMLYELNKDKDDIKFGGCYRAF